MPKHHVVVDAMTLTKGDRVLLFLPDDLTTEDAETIKDELTVAFPGVQFLAIIGGEGYVLRNNDKENYEDVSTE